MCYPETKPHSQESPPRSCAALCLVLQTIGMGRGNCHIFLLLSKGQRCTNTLTCILPTHCINTHANMTLMLLNSLEPIKIHGWGPLSPVLSSTVLQEDNPKHQQPAFNQQQATRSPVVPSKEALHLHHRTRAHQGNGWIASPQQSRVPFAREGEFGLYQDNSTAALGRSLCASLSLTHCCKV